VVIKIISFIHKQIPYLWLLKLLAISFIHKQKQLQIHNFTHPTRIVSQLTYNLTYFHIGIWIVSNLSCAHDKQLPDISQTCIPFNNFKDQSNGHFPVLWC